MRTPYMFPTAARFVELSLVEQTGLAVFLGQRPETPAPLYSPGSALAKGAEQSAPTTPADEPLD